MQSIAQQFQISYYNPLYIFAPAGGGSTGWQLALRSKNVFGPYEERVVMEQGSTEINGPHQGGWVELDSKESWFIHFQDKEAYGRIVHLPPMEWINDWPVIGEDKDKDGTGLPVLSHKKPDVGTTFPVVTPGESDEFDSNELALQWQWHANPKHTWAFSNSSKGYYGSIQICFLKVPKTFGLLPTYCFKNSLQPLLRLQQNLLFILTTNWKMNGLVLLGWVKIMRILRW